MSERGSRGRACERLFAAYAEWKAVTEQEREGILKGDWGLVEAAQQTKSRLQAEIIQLTTDARTEAGDALTEWETEVRVIVDELIRLETENGKLIETERNTALGKVHECDRARQTLRNIQKGYSNRVAGSWESFG